MRLFLWLAAGAGLAFAADAPRVSYTKIFPGSDPAYMAITVDRDGAVVYREARDEEPETFKLEAEAVQAIFDLAGKLDHFKRPLESGLKVAKTGDKTFHWENGAESSETKFNFSLDENAKLLQDWFERISESERVMMGLRRAIRFDRLGINDAVLRADTAWSQKRLVGREQFLPLLDRISKNESFINMARERAARLADTLRAAGEKVAVQ
ncbi:MAG: hypothetical protein JWO19_370 [Bryobacterales bacterium]|nr:hypothetical protein [Bryobacterales bacterium]